MKRFSSVDRKPTDILVCPPEKPLFKAKQKIKLMSKYSSVQPDNNLRISHHDKFYKFIIMSQIFFIIYYCFISGIYYVTTLLFNL